MSAPVEFRCIHCRCVCATATGDWDDGAISDDEVLMVCEDCARCDKSPQSTPLLARLLRGLQ